MTGSPESCSDSGKNQVEKVFGQMKCVTDAKDACSHLHSEKRFDLDSDENCEDNSNEVSKPKQRRKTKSAK